MATSSKDLLFATTILCTIAVAYCVTPDFSDYDDGVLRCNNDRKTIRLGPAVSSKNKNFMEVQSFKGDLGVNMYIRIAPRSDSDEVKAAELDYEDTKKKFEEKHPDTVSYKIGHSDRRVIGIPDFGFGSVTKKGKDTVPCYYFVVQYSDDYSDYAGGTIVCTDGRLIELEPIKKDGRTTESSYALKVKTVKGKKYMNTYVRIAPLSNFDEVVTTIADWEDTTHEIENPSPILHSMHGVELYKRPVSIPSEGNGVLKKNGKDDVVCYYFVVECKPLD